MRLASSALIKQIDLYAEKELNIDTRELMARSGLAVAERALKMSGSGDTVLVLCGKGNNGGDGYAAAMHLSKERNVKILAPFGAEQKNQCGKFYFEKCRELGICIRSGIDGAKELIKSSSLIIDAIFGIGFSGELSFELCALSELIRESGKPVLAVDLPLGIDGDTARVATGAIKADATVALTLKKPAHVSYPAKEYMGSVSLCTIGLDEYLDRFEYNIFEADEELFRSAFPKRDPMANKGSFGKTVHVTGSEKYRGAAHLALEASLRSGVGITYHAGGGELAKELRLKFPEAIYIDMIKGALEEDPIAKAVGKYSSVLIGSGSSISKELSELIESVIKTDGAPLVLDADGINSLAKYSSAEVLKSAKRTVILTPHPLELSRLFGYSPDDINKNRLPLAMELAKEYGIILLLKGAGTVITDGERAYINTSGSTALSKGGSGDVLAGLLASAVASAEDTLAAVAACAYIHGRAGDTLSAELSDYGVTPSDLPMEIGRHIKLILG